MDAEVALMALATEYWRLIRAQKRLINQHPIERRAKLEAQLKFATGRLTSILNDVGISLGLYDGSDYGASLPIMAVNGDDFKGEEGLCIAETLEPAYLKAGVVIAHGRVMIKKKET